MSQLRRREKVQVRELLTAELPFPVGEVKSVFMMCVMGFASEELCEELAIHACGYRYISREESGSRTLVFILKDERIQGKVIKLPLRIAIEHQEPIIFHRGVFDIIKNPIPIPNFPKLSKLHVILPSWGKNVPELERLIISLITKSSFFLRMPEETKWIRCSWLENRPELKEFPIRTLIQVRKWIAMEKEGRYENWIGVQMRGVFESSEKQKSEYGLFWPNFTKIETIKTIQHPSTSVHRKIKLTPLEREVFEQGPYLEMIKNLTLALVEPYQLVLLQSAPELGIHQLIHHQADEMGYKFITLDCEMMVSERELLDGIKQVGDEMLFIYVRHIDWLLQVSNKSDKQESIKSILSSLQSIYNEKLLENCYKKLCLMIEYDEKSHLSVQMLKSTNYIGFQLEKEEKLAILVLVLDGLLEGYEHKLTKSDIEQLLNSIVNSMGWVKFIEVMRLVLSSLKHDEITLDTILKQLAHHAKIEKVENVKAIGWDDVGGLASAKNQLMQTLLLPLHHPEIFDNFIQPRTGLLFYGPPGTGKTMLGKCIANECKMGFISVKGPELLNMYVGESEKNVRDVFERAVASKPCIVFMDELDAIVPKRGNSGDSGQVMDRIVAELLMQMDRAGGEGVFVIGATNRPDLLDPSILRPGRFDKQIYLGISTDQESRIQILKAQTRKIKLSDPFSFSTVESHIPKNFTGADFYGLTSKSIMRAAERTIQLIQTKQIQQEQQVITTEEDFIETVKNMKPSVSLKELEHYEALKLIYK